MTDSLRDTETVLIKLWRRLAAWPGGRWLFHRILSRRVPYSGSIPARIVQLSPGYCQIQLSDRRRIRNHLNCIHAVALVNMGELTSGLALLSGLPDTMRGIVTQLTTEYYKKARGPLHAECSCHLPEFVDRLDIQVVADIMDQQGDRVARTTASWRLDRMT